MTFPPRACYRRPPHQRGFTLIELAIVLGVLAIIIAGIWLVVGVTFENTRQYQANRQLQTMVQNIRALESRITHFTSTSDITASMDAQGAFPLDMRINQSVGNGNLNNPWSGTGDSVHVYSRDAVTFGVEFKNLPKKPCIQIATKLSGGEMSGLKALVINGTPTTAANLPLTLVSASLACTQAGATNVVEWQFSLSGN